VDGMSYDQLLALSDRIGDVAKERWALRSAAFIATLPHYVHRVLPTPGAAATAAACCEGHGDEHPPSHTADAIGESLDRFASQATPRLPPLPRCFVPLFRSGRVRGGWMLAVCVGMCVWVCVGVWMCGCAGVDLVCFCAKPYSVVCSWRHHPFAFLLLLLPGAWCVSASTRRQRSCLCWRAGTCTTEVRPPSPHVTSKPPPPTSLSMPHKCLFNKLMLVPLLSLLCAECVATWLTTNKTCPVCKFDVTTPAEASAPVPASASASAPAIASAAVAPVSAAVAPAAFP
jgi:hypothetical protein